VLANMLHSTVSCREDARLGSNLGQLDAYAA